MVFADMLGLVPLGVTRIGKISLDGANIWTAGSVGSRAINIFSIYVRPLTEADFLVLFILILSTFISPFIMAHDRKYKVFLSGTKKEPAFNHYGGLYSGNYLSFPLHKKREGNYGNKAGAGKKGID